MAEFIPDNIDFETYLNLTDAGHKVLPASAYVDAVIDRIHNYTGPRGDVMPWNKTHDMLRFREGEVTLWSGYNGSGKSLVLNQVITGLVLQQRKCCIASMEMPVIDNLHRMATQSSGGSNPAKSFIQMFFGQATDNLLWMYDQQGTIDAAKMLAVMRYFAQEKQGQHFVLDSLMKCGLPEDGNGYLSGQARFVDQITAIARDTGMHIHLVAHSRKSKDESQEPGKMDVKGSGTITDLVHNSVVVWRNKPKEEAADRGEAADKNSPDTFLICDKQRNFSWEGRFGLWFDKGSGQFVQDCFRGTMDMWDSSNYSGIGQ